MAENLEVGQKVKYRMMDGRWAKGEVIEIGAAKNLGLVKVQWEVGQRDGWIRQHELSMESNG